uniref:Copia protein n=1 Tax=Tanacetum cinerariifolium TaxID=118510 RepID=A0A6L2KEK3_TANCI|nr:copia protein [Tanacetum cinerariifolium]
MNELEQVKKEKEGLDSKLTGFESTSKDLDTLLGSQRTNKNKEGLRYSAVPPPAQIYLPHKKDMSWIGLPEFADDTVTDYSRPTPSIDSSKSNTSDLQNSNSSVFDHKESSSSIIYKPMIKFVKAADCLEVIKTNKVETTRKSSVKYAEMYRNTSKSPKVTGTSSTNILGIKDVASQAVKKDVSSLRYIAILNWFYEAHLESSNSDAQDACNADVTESSGISNPTATLKIPPVDQMETLIVEYEIPTVSSPVLTACLDNSLETSRVRPIGTKWVLKNKKDERGIVIRNKARLVAHGYTQEEGIDYEKVFTPVARIEAIRLFLVYDLFIGFIVYQMDVKSAFLYGTIDEEVYMMQPPGFQDLEFPNRVYKVKKAMYRLHQAPKAWYGTMSKQFEALMHDKFQMSALGELTFFLGLQVLQKKDGIFFHKTSMLVIFSKILDTQMLGQPILLWIRRILREKIYLTIVATSTTKAKYVAAASGCGQVLWIQNHMLDYGLAFYDYHNIIAILEKSKHNIDFHQIVDFLEASHIRYALPSSPTVNVSHILQFWSTARIKTTSEETKILATIDGKPMTISESSIRRNLKLNDEEGISSLLDTELFENLALMRYNILPNQRFTFQKGQFSHQWRFLIHTIMQCLSQKSTGFNEFSSNIATDVVCLATNRVYNFSKMIFDGMSKALSPAANEPASLLRDDSQGEAFPTVSSLDARQDRENINKTSALPHESTPRVTSLDADEGSMQQNLYELMELYTGLQRQQTQMATKIKAQDFEISGLKGIIEIGEEVRVEKSTELGSNDTKEMVNVLSSMEAMNILTSGVTTVSVSPVAGVSTVGVPTVSGLFPTVSAIFTNASMVTPYSGRLRGIPAKDKGKEKVVESKELKKKLQEQINAQVAREIEEEFARENQRMNEQLARDAEIARLHAKEELKMLIDGLDRSNEVIAKHLQEYEQSEVELTVEEKIKLMNKLVKYQDHHAKILKYQAQQSKPLSKKEQYMSVLRSHDGWKTKHFRGMTLEEIKEKFILVWKQIEHFVSMYSKEEGERIKKKGLNLDQGSAKRLKTSEDVSKKDLKEMMHLVPLEEVYVEALHVKHPIIDWEIHFEGQREYWKIIRLGGHTAVYHFFVDMLKQFDREDLNQLWTLVKETLSIRQVSRDKEKELWAESKRMFEPDFEDQL